MKVIVLAAGYATRLYPLTLNQPKPLLAVAGRPMLDHVLDALAPIGGIDRVYVVTTAKFPPHFEKWAAAHPSKETLRVINDRTTDDTNKLGAIGDLHLVMTQERLDDDLLVIAGDNLFSKPLEGLVEFCQAQTTPVLGVYDVKSVEEAKKYGVVSVENGRITSFVEKPTQAASTLIGIALYYYPRATLPLIRQYIAEGNNPDQPGRLVQWLYPRTPVRTWSIPGLWLDIGSKETLEEAQRFFAAK